MIRVAPQPEPLDFDDQVRQPGIRALQETKKPLDLPPYWRRCLGQLYDAYGRTCAYTCFYIEAVTGNRTVDHYVPRSSDPSLTYEWSNYRLACGRMNARKGAAADALDPMEIGDCWFCIDFADFRVVPADGLDADTKAMVIDTISRLGLDDPECNGRREEYFNDYRSGELSVRLLRRGCPFLEREMRRQDLLRPEDRS